LEDFYVLPEITYVAGEKQTVRMYLWTPFPNSQKFNAFGCAVDFSIINYSNKNGLPIISKGCEIRQDTDGTYCIAVAILEPQDTVTLFGKYVYQISIKDSENNTDIPWQGIMFIVKNINQRFITG
jgi:hypothetical protein